MLLEVLDIVGDMGGVDTRHGCAFNNDRIFSGSRSDKRVLKVEVAAPTLHINE
jgi:hypothetical protein